MKNKYPVVQSQDNTFVLKKYVMKSRYYAVRRADLQHSLNNPETPVYYTLTQHPDYRTVTATLVLFEGSERLGIGCQTFVGKDYRRLLRWAKEFIR